MLKRSEDTIKLINPGFQITYRIIKKDPDLGEVYKADVTCLRGDATAQAIEAGQTFTIYDEQDRYKYKTFEAGTYSWRHLQDPVIQNGEPCFIEHTLSEKKAFYNDTLHHFSPSERRLINPHYYKVDISESWNGSTGRLRISTSTDVGKLFAESIYKKIITMKKTVLFFLAACMTALMAAAMPASARTVRAAGDDVTVAQAEETFDVYLKEVGVNKVKVVKILRTHLEVDLKVAYEMVQEAPTVVGEALSAEKAKALEKELKEAGATVELKAPKEKK